jgi:hypothetical protein
VEILSKEEVMMSELCLGKLEWSGEKRYRRGLVFVCLDVFLGLWGGGIGREGN